MKNLIILVTAFLFIVSFSCNFNKTNKSHQIDETRENEFFFDTNYFHPLHIDNIAFLINWTIEDAIEPYIEISDNNRDKVHFGINPRFYGSITDFDILNNLSQIKGKDTTIVYNADELNQFINDNNYLKGKTIEAFVAECFENYLSDDIFDINFLISPPLVDRKNSIVCVLFRKILKINEGYTGYNYFVVYKLTTDCKGWYLFNIIEIQLSWEIEKFGYNNAFELYRLYE